ncbi:MAG: malic enzyme-like NAD(P)-binding protein [Nitrospira sp.]
MAHPDPEGTSDLARLHCWIFAIGCSDFSHHINNARAFPCIVRGALDGRAPEIHEVMKLAAAEAVAHAVPEGVLSEEDIIPNLFDKTVVSRVAHAVALAARKTVSLDDVLRWRANLTMT